MFFRKKTLKNMQHILWDKRQLKIGNNFQQIINKKKNL